MRRFTFPPLVAVPRKLSRSSWVIASLVIFPCGERDDLPAWSVQFAWKVWFPADTSAGVRYQPDRGRENAKAWLPSMLSAHCMPLASIAEMLNVTLSTVVLSHGTGSENATKGAVRSMPSERREVVLALPPVSAHPTRQLCHPSSREAFRAITPTPGVSTLVTGTSSENRVQFARAASSEALTRNDTRPCANTVPFAGATADTECGRTSSMEKLTCPVLFSTGAAAHRASQECCPGGTYAV